MLQWDRYTHSWVRWYFCMTSWSYFKHPEDIYPICSQQKCLHFRGLCVQILLLFLSHFSYFSPIHSNSTDSPSCAGSLTSRSPICRCPRRNASSDRRRNRRNLLLCRRYRRPSWVGRWGWNHGQNGGGEQTTNEDGDIVPTLPYPNVKFPPWTPWF